MLNSLNWTLIAALSGGISVILGAFGAHALENRLDEKALSWFRTGSQYQMMHALALLGWSLWLEAKRQAGAPTPSPFTGWAFTLGALVFSGTLYAMALGAPRWLGAVTPVGGSLLIAGWILFAYQALR